MRQRGRYEGFTLLETLVALVVASLVLSVMTVLISSLADLRHRFDRLDVARAELTTAHDVLADLFIAALPGQSDTHDVGGTQQSLTVLSRGTPIMLEPSQLTFSMSEDSNGHLSVSWYSLSANRAQIRILLQTASRFAFRYLLSGSANQPATWSTSWTNPDVLPQAIELTVEYQDIEAPFTLVFLTFERYPYACEHAPTLSHCGDNYGKP